MQTKSGLKYKKNISILKIIIPVTFVSSLLIWAANDLNNKNNQASIGKDIIRCIVDDNAFACKKVINNCSNDTTGSCKKLLFYSDDGVHSEEALSILGNICSKGGEQACDLLINRCIENNLNCEIIGKTYSIKNYLSMKADTKNTGKNVMYKKLKNYYDNDVDNIVSSVINTCMTDKQSMACQIFTSKTYEFSLDEKPNFEMNQNSKREIKFSKTGISLAVVSEVSENDEEKKHTVSPDKISESPILTELPENKQTNSITKNTEIVIEENTENSEPAVNTIKLTTEKQTNKEEVLQVSDKNVVIPKEKSDSVFKAYLITGENNNISYIKNKIYSFDILYKEPENTKIKWLVSFDGKATWKKWNGSEWIQADNAYELQNIDFSIAGNNSSEIMKGLKNYKMQQGETSLDFAVELISHDEISTPSIDKVEVKYY